MKKTFSLPRVLLLFALPALFGGLFSSCGEESAESTLFAMDTAISLRITGKNAGEVMPLLEEELRRLDLLLDAEGDSLSSLRETGSLSDPEIAGLLAESLRISGETGGAFDVTVEPAVEAWGFRSGNTRVPSDEELLSLLEKTGYESVRIDGDEIALPAGYSVTFGAVAKGYAGDRLRAIAEENGIVSGVLSLGGNVALLGKKDEKAGKGWSVAVRAPEGGYALTLELSDTNAVTSGSYERYFEKDGVRYHHILDPATLKPAETGLVSVTVVSRNGLLADALSTALFVMGPEGAADYWRSFGEAQKFEILLLTEDHRILASKGLVPLITGVEEPYGELVVIE
ncbi:MAG: FAD:protein FMN transferase [Clostridia bacterium]|nr:FAD:protein FMN transferase [Clostridia bacterium]